MQKKGYRFIFVIIVYTIFFAAISKNVSSYQRGRYERERIEAKQEYSEAIINNFLGIYVSKSMDASVIQKKEFHFHVHDRMKMIKAINPEIEDIFVYGYKDDSLYKTFYLPDHKEQNYSYELVELIADKELYTRYYKKEVDAYIGELDDGAKHVFTSSPIYDKATNELIGMLVIKYNEEIWHQYIIKHMIFVGSLTLATYFILLAVTVLIASNFYLKKEREKLKEANENINETRIFYQNMFDLNRSMMMIVDAATGDILNVNQSLIDFFGYGKEEFTDKTVMELLDIKAENIFAELEKGIDNSTSEFYIGNQLKDGSNRYVYVRTTHLQMEDKDILYGIITDVTTEVKLKETIQRVNVNFRNLFNSFSDMIFVTDLDGNIIQANYTVYGRLGYSEEELLKLKMPDIQVDQGIERTTFTKTNSHYAIFVQKDGATINVETRLVFGEWDEKRAIFILCTDITRRIKVERELIQAKEAAEESNRIKGDFIANMSHEIRTPMNGVLGFLQLLQFSDLEEREKGYVEDGIYSAKAMLDIVNGILDFSKLEAGKLPIDKTIFNFRNMMDNVVKMNNPILKEKELTYTVSIDENIPEALFGDEAKIKQILNNLIGNAIKFTSEGSIDVEIKQVQEEEKRLELRFDITDTGIGIPRERQKELFEPFIQGDSTTTREYGGTGLGLSIIKELVALMDGEVFVESELGKGATFTVIVWVDKVDQSGQL